ncbi:Sir2 family NAD-dependent protein deacetylase [Mannheimia massilioguelmaensis]|uniref:Sir2 family NAD-dependent protein deacetylase n=1 Tax=Mannheimia massilioguelmaensis TaxID=1604354 RepID=UPI0005CA993E|nr:Sir2 family NAD-dependent protein deacetylase [Mannheimia massilioguelmaensis]
MNTIYQHIAEKIKQADAILIGASNGLSISEGFNIFADNVWFQQHFADFRSKFAIHSILQGYFYDYQKANQHWAYIARLANLKRFHEHSTSMMQNLYQLVSNKPHFVLTSNTEDHFTLAGFKSENVFELEGKITESHCAAHCHDGVYDNSEALKAMENHTQTTELPDYLLPKCPKCGGDMKVNIGHGERFFSTSHWQVKQRDLQGFLQQHSGKIILVLEFGIGFRNQLIKAPLMNLVASQPNAFYVTFNKGELYIPEQIAHQSLGVDGDIADALEAIISYL